MTPTRRRFLGLLAGPLTIDAASPVEFTDYGPAFRIEAQASNPRVKCFDLRSLTSWKTPAEKFFAFHQTKAPAGIDPRNWRLEISGSIARPRTLTFDDLAAYPAKEVPATIECSGNSGQPQLMNGLVSNGVWTGPELAPLLRDCGILPEAREVVFFGADTERESKWPAGNRAFDVPHGRSIFVQDALNSGAILALQLNGRPLPGEHGFPLRLVLPGWYGMAQIKWLSRIVVLDRRYEGRHMARNYHSVRIAPGNLTLETSIGRNRLKSVIASVTGAAISGAVWGGRNPIERVEVRIGNQPWREAEFTKKNGPEAWSLWTCPWIGASPGQHTIVSRAIDSQGVIQPERHTMESAREDNSQWVRTVRVSESGQANRMLRKPLPA
jgi:DMSO/TMAO reductase YedYZ molybdopterin-dependent catalytic subunit